MGESVTEVQISEWLKAEGEMVKPDEPVAVLDSAKSTFELPAPQAGKITKILRRAGDTVLVGEVIAEFEPGGSAAKSAGAEAAQPSDDDKSAPKAQPPAKAQTPPTDKEPPPEASGGKNGQAEEPPPESAKADSPKPEPSKPDAPPKPPAAPVVKEAKPDAKSSSSPAKPEVASGRGEEVVPMTMLRRTIARRLVEAQQGMAMLTTFNEADMSAVQAMRHEYQEAFEKRYHVKLGFMSFFIKAAVDALNQFPQLNAEVRADDIVYRNYFDIGVAVSTERGLVVPVLRNAEQLSFAELEKAVGDFSKRAKEGQLKPQELAGGTFTITNGGVFGSLLSTPIINPPQTGILGLHTIQDRPIALNGQVVIRPMMYIALTYDHRVVDGREAVLFLRRIKQAIENPARILLEI